MVALLRHATMEPAMNGTSFQSKYASAALRTEGQTLDQVHKIVADILRRGGCPSCGRLAYLNVHFHADPPPELGKLNVASYSENGFGH